MSYLVLARKYRPKTFADVVGQAHVTRPLVNALSSGRIAHAYLFTGARGVGKTTAARLLAMALSCPDQGEDGPCGSCDTCRDIIEGQAVDVFEIDGASNRGINEIRDLRETIKYLPTKGQYKVYIIDEVHMLTKEAFNALLKTLEEPPAHVVFIFATTEVHKVLPTILSRCQRYDFKRIGLEGIVGRLTEIAQAEGIEVSPKALRLMAREAEGGLRDALSLFDQVIAFSGTSVSDEDVVEALGLIDRTLVSGLARSVLDGDAGDALGLLDQVYNFGHDIKDFAVQVLEYYRALNVAKVSRQPERILELLDAELDDVRELAGRFSLETLNFHFNAWLDVQSRLARSARPRLILEALIIRLAQTEPLVPLAELAARLEELLSRSGAGPASGGSPRGGPSPGGPPPSTRGLGRASGSYSGAAAEREASPKARREEPADPGSAPIAASGPGDWREFLILLRRENPILATMLAKAGVDEFSAARVALSLGPDEKAAQIYEQELQSLLHGFFGSRPTLIFNIEETARANGGASVSGAAPANDEFRRQILDHPAVKEMMEIFPGEVVEVTPEN